MATEGAAGLSTAAIELCIGGWESETQNDADGPTARAELATLVRDAERWRRIEALARMDAFYEFVPPGYQLRAAVWFCSLR